MAILLVSAIFLFAMILQVAIISDIHLIQGTADLLLLIYIAWSINKRTKFNIELALNRRDVGKFCNSNSMLYCYSCIYCCLYFE